MISVDGLTVEFGGTTLFQDVSFVINEKDRIALMGKTGPENLPCSRYLPEHVPLHAVIYRHPKTR